MALKSPHSLYELRLPLLLLGFQIKQDRNGCLASFLHVVARCSQPFANMGFSAPPALGRGKEMELGGNLSPKLPLYWGQARVSKNASKLSCSSEDGFFWVGH